MREWNWNVFWQNFIMQTKKTTSMKLQFHDWCDANMLISYAKPFEWFTCDSITDNFGFYFERCLPANQSKRSTRYSVKYNWNWLVSSSVFFIMFLSAYWEWICWGPEYRVVCVMSWRIENISQANFSHFPSTVNRSIIVEQFSPFRTPIRLEIDDEPARRCRLGNRIWDNTVQFHQFSVNCNVRIIYFLVLLLFLAKI